MERNLYLTMQLMELGIPMVLALNMMDEVRANRMNAPMYCAHRIMFIVTCRAKINPAGTFPVPRHMKCMVNHYSLSPYSSEEIVTRDFLMDTHPDGIINIVDATNMERNLYLTMQVMELTQ